MEAIHNRPGRSISQLFTDQAFRRFFVPALLSNLGLALGGLADCLVVGSKLGTGGLSAIALGIPIYLFYNVLSYGFSIGGSIHYASELAGGHPENGLRLFNNVFRFLLATYLVTVTLGLIFQPQLMLLLGADPADSEVYTIAYRYIRAQLISVPVLFCQGPLYYFVNCDGAPKRAAAALVTSNIIDIILNYVFVFQLDMGAEGSVWSTLVGALFCLAICGDHILRRRGELRFCRAKLAVSDLTRSIRTGIVSAVQYIFQFICVLILNKLLMNNYGSDGVAVFDVVYNLSLLTAALADGTGMAIQPMVSTFRAERNTVANRRTLSLALRVGSIGCLAVVLFLSFGARPLCDAFGLAGASLNLGTKALLVYCISVLPSYWNQCIIYYDQAAELERYAFIAEALRLFGCWLPACLLLGLIFPNMIWWVFPLSEIGALIYIISRHKKRMQSSLPLADEQLYTAVLTTDTDLGEQVAAFQQVCESWDVDMRQAYYGTLVLEELCAAILEDARRNRLKDISLQFSIVHSPQGITLHLRDNSVKFNPFELQNGEEEDINILGMEIVRKKAKEFFYRRYQGFNTLVVRL